MYPGILAVSIMGVSFYSTISTIWDREFGFLKEILVAPVSRSAIILGKAIGVVTIASSQALVLLIITPFLGIKIHLVIIFSRINPLTYAVDAFRHIILSPQITMEVKRNILLNPMSIDLFYLLFFGIAMILLATFVFNKKG